MSTLKQKTIGKATVIVDIVAKGNFEIRPEYAMNPKEIAIHNTGNSGRGANAKAHNTYIHNMSELPASATGFASWHFSVDDKFIYQHIPLNESAWHTGDGNSLTSGNRMAIAIEICENSDMENYAQAEENAIALAVVLMKMFNIPSTKVKPHQAYSGKYCPRVILGRDGSFLPFLKRVENASKGYKAPASSVAGVSTSKPSVSKPKPSTGAVGGRLEAQAGKTVNFYSKPSFDSKYRVGAISGSVGFPKVVKEVAVNGGKMYHVRNSRNISYYITSRADLVKVIGGSAPVAKPKPKPKPKPPAPTKSSIKAVGKVKVANLNNFTYVYEKTSDGSKKIQKAHKGAVYSISGSVTGWYEVIVNGKRAYIKSKYCQQV